MNLEENHAWPQSGAKLFIGSGSKYELSHFGWEVSTEAKFYSYMQGYKKAADLLIESSIKSKDISIIDTVIYPVCFLYRQYLELAMKNIYLSYSGDDSNKKIKLLKGINHDLIKIWIKIKPYLKKEATDKDIDDINIVEDYIKQFYNLDKFSSTFRYPITKYLKVVINSQKIVNLSELKSRMDELYNFFDGCMGKLNYSKEFKKEIIQSLQSEYLDYI
jgi:hypothetical protein